MDCIVLCENLVGGIIDISFGRFFVFIFGWSLDWFGYVSGRGVGDLVLKDVMVVNVVNIYFCLGIEYLCF